MKEKFNEYLLQYEVKMSSKDWNWMLKNISIDWECKISELKRRMRDDWEYFIAYVIERLEIVKTGCNSKTRYRNRSEARNATHKSSRYKYPDRVYKCKWCERWHVTSNFKRNRQYHFKYNKI